MYRAYIIYYVYIISHLLYPFARVKHCTILFGHLKDDTFTPITCFKTFQNMLPSGCSILNMASLNKIKTKQTKLFWYSFGRYKVCARSQFS